MKKVLTILAVLALAAPAMAQQVTFSAVDNNDGTCDIFYTCTEADGPVGIALVVDGDNAVDAVTVVESFFDVFIDAAYDMETTTPGSYTYGAGQPVAQIGGPGQATLPLADFVISLAGLGGAAAPLATPPTGATPIKLCTLTSDENVVGTLTIDDGLRGPVVNKNGAMTSNIDAAATIPFTITVGGPVDCIKDTHPNYLKWSTTYGKPDCWCFRKQCRGDANGKLALGRPVQAADLNILAAVYGKTEAEVLAYWNGTINGICADFTQSSALGRPVQAADLNQFALYYNLPDASVPECPMTYINEWKTPL